MTHRLHLFWRICAVCLLLLAASPVTAPFATFDLGDSHRSDLSSEQAVKVSMHDKIAATSLMTIPETAAFLPPDVNPTAGGRPEATSRTQEGRNLHQILRV